MRICHLTSAHPSQDIRIFIKECKSLDEAGFDVHLVAPDVTEGTSDQEGVFLHSIKKGRSRITRMTGAVWRVFREAVKVKAALYHFHDPELLPVGLLLKLLGKKVVYDVHEDVPRQMMSKAYLPESLRKVLSVVFEWFENFAARRFDAIVTATPHINDRFLALGCHAVNINNYPLMNELKVNDTNWNEKKRVICYIGAISNIRGVEEMVRAVGWTDIHLLLGGKFTSVAEKANVQSLPGWERVEELGQINRLQVADVLERSMAGLVLFHPLPNHVNAQPNKLFEYMSSGIPVIASNFPLWRDIIEVNEAGLCVDPMDPSKIAEAITFIADHPEQARAMGERGRRAVVEIYNWEKEKIKLNALYQELLEDRVVRRSL